MSNSRSTLPCLAISTSWQYWAYLSLCVVLVGCAPQAHQRPETQTANNRPVSAPTSTLPVLSPGEGKPPPPRATEAAAPVAIHQGNKVRVSSPPTRERPEIELKAFSAVSVGGLVREDPLAGRVIEAVAETSKGAIAKTCVTGSDGTCRLNLVQDFGIRGGEIDSKTRVKLAVPGVPGVAPTEITVDNIGFLQAVLVVEVGQHRVYGSADYSKPLNAEVRKGEKLPVATADKAWICLKLFLAGTDVLGCVPKYVGRAYLEAPRN